MTLKTLTCWRVSASVCHLGALLLDVLFTSASLSNNITKRPDSHQRLRPVDIHSCTCRSGPVPVTVWGWGSPSWKWRWLWCVCSTASPLWPALRPRWAWKRNLTQKFIQLIYLSLLKKQTFFSPCIKERHAVLKTYLDVWYPCLSSGSTWVEVNQHSWA